MRNIKREKKFFRDYNFPEINIYYATFSRKVQMNSIDCECIAVISIHYSLISQSRVTMEILEEESMPMNNK